MTHGIASVDSVFSDEGEEPANGLPLADILLAFEENLQER
jgi:hypothetical protein